MKNQEIWKERGNAILLRMVALSAKEKTKKQRPVLTNTERMQIYSGIITIFWSSLHIFILRQCPVDAAWSAWASGWSKCSANCLKKGESLPTKTRSRVCQPERFGGKTCKVLEKEATDKKLALYEEEQDCTSLPNCPKPASLSPWSEWSQCSVTCYPENESVPQSVRSRTCKKALLSSSSALNADVLTCQALGEMNAYKNCEIPACPGSIQD